MRFLLAVFFFIISLPVFSQVDTLITHTQFIVTLDTIPVPLPTVNAGPDKVITLPVTTTSFTAVPTGSVVSYQWTQIAGTTATITNPNNATTGINGLTTTGSRTFVITIVNGVFVSASDTVMVFVNPPLNIPPSANAGADSTITLPVNSVHLLGSGTDPDGTITGYLWTKISGPVGGSISTPTTATTLVTGLTEGTHQFRLRVTDNNGDTGVAVVKVFVLPAIPNVPPSANAGADQNITLPVNSITVNGSGTDPDGTIVGYLWRKLSGPTGGTIASSTSATTGITALQQGTYIFQLRVTDNFGDTGVDNMQVIVNAAIPNVPPTADAGADQAITLPTNTVTLTGSGTDPDGTIVAYLWTKISGPSGGTITSSTSATTGVTALQEGTYSFRLRVTDNVGDTGIDVMQVVVSPAPPNVPPTANAGPDQAITLPTNSITLSGSGTDPDGSIVAYLWTKISGPTGGTITTPTSASSGVTALQEGTYTFKLRVTDNSGDTAIDFMQVLVNPAIPPPNTPPTANAGVDKNITLPTNSVTVTGSGTDPDGTIVAYLWTKLSGPTGGTIASPTSATTSITALQQGTYIFKLRVTDNAGDTGVDNMQVIVNAAIPNVPPTANAGVDQTITLPINSVTLTGSGTDPDGTIASYLWVKLSGPAGGTITSPTSATTGVTALQQGTYIFKLRVTDNVGDTGVDNMQVIVNAAIPNVPPTANAGVDQTITLPTSSVTLTGSGTDPDGTVVAYLWTKISGPSGGTISFPNNSTTSVTALQAGTYSFKLRVTDNVGDTGIDVMQVFVNPAPVNVPPTANAGANQTIILPATTTTLVGSGTDTDGTIVGYLWTKTSGPTGGTITSPNLATTGITALQQGAYIFKLTVTDNLGATGTSSVVVTVNPPPNIPPVANAGPDQTKTLPTNSFTFAGSGSDPDGTVASHVWSKVSGGAATITTPTSYTSTVTGLVAGVYLFQLLVTDNIGAVGIDTMQVTINPNPTDTTGYPNLNGANNYYFAPWGNNANSGKLTTAPRLTIDWSVIVPGDSLLFRAGQSFYGSIIPTKSGSAAKPITFGSYGIGVKPLMTGMTTLTGWTNIGGNIWQSAVVTLKNYVNILTINRQPYPVGHTDWIQYQSSTSTSLTSSSLTGTPNYTGAQIVIKESGFLADKGTVTSQSGSTVQIANNTQPLFNNKLRGISPGKANFGFFLQRFAGSLDQQGEWFYDIPNKKMRLYSTTDPNLSEVKASSIDTIFLLSNKTNITLYNLTIEGGNQYGVETYGGSNIVVKNCTFYNNTAPIYAYNCTGLTVDNDSLVNNFSIGVWVYGSSTAPSRNINIRNNYVVNTGQFMGNGVYNSEFAERGIVAFTDSNRTLTFLNIIGNRVINTGNGVIQYQGSNVLVRRNVCDTFCNIQQDNGGIYTFINNQSTNNYFYFNRRVDSNFISNAIGSPQGENGNIDVTGWYNDDQVNDVIGEYNTIWNIPGNGIQLNNPKDITIRNNTVYNCLYAYCVQRKQYGNITGISLKKNFFYPLTSSQWIILYNNTGLNNTGQTITQALTSIGNIDSNYVNMKKVTGFKYYYAATQGGAYTFPPDYNLASWRTNTTHDVQSASANAAKTTLLFTNTTNGVTTNTLPAGNWLDIFGTVYSGSFTLASFSSKVLIAQ